MVSPHYSPLGRLLSTREDPGLELWSWKAWSPAGHPISDLSLQILQTMKVAHREQWSVSGRTTWSGREHRQVPGGDPGRQIMRDGEKGKACWQD